jgi:hypothetical protein
LVTNHDFVIIPHFFSGLVLFSLRGFDPTFFASGQTTLSFNPLGTPSIFGGGAMITSRMRFANFIGTKQGLILAKKMLRA